MSHDTKSMKDVKIKFVARSGDGESSMFHSQKRFFKDVKSRVGDIAEDYIKKQRELIEERTQKTSSPPKKDGTSSVADSALKEVRHGSRSAEEKNETVMEEFDGSSFYSEKSSFQTNESMREDSDMFEGQLQIVKETPRENDINNVNVDSGLATQRFTPKKMLKVFSQPNILPTFRSKTRINKSSTSSIERKSSSPEVKYNLTKTILSNRQKSLPSNDDTKRSQHSSKSKV